MSFKLDARGLFDGLDSFENRVKVAIKLYGETSGKKLEREAKDKAPWTDRSGDARRTISGGAEQVGDVTQIYLSGNMSYSAKLELSRAGRYAILLPTIDNNTQDIIKGLGRLLK